MEKKTVHWYDRENPGREGAFWLERTARGELAVIRELFAVVDRQEEEITRLKGNDAEVTAYTNGLRDSLAEANDLAGHLRHQLEERDRELSELRHAGTESHIQTGERKAFEAARRGYGEEDGFESEWTTFDDWRASLKQEEK